MATERLTHRSAATTSLTRNENDVLITTGYTLSRICATKIICATVGGRMTELKEHFGLRDEDLNLDLGPLGRLL